MRVLLTAMLMAAVVAASFDAAAAYRRVTGFAAVRDGDTLVLQGPAFPDAPKPRVVVFITLDDIDAPEADQICQLNGEPWECGHAATRALRAKIAANPVTCDGGSNDRNNRLRATCYVKGENLNRWMVLNGWALAARLYSTTYLVEERWAKKHRMGLWEGEFATPWEWRGDQ